MEVVDRDLLEDVASMKPSLPTGEERRDSYGGEGGFDLAGWIEDKNIGVVRENAWIGNGYKWILEECPWNGHTDNAPYIVRLPGGAIGAGCHHNSCQGYGWRELREHYEPGCYEPGCYEREVANGEAIDDRIYFSGVKDGSGARLPEVPRFPVEALPASLKRFVEEAAASIGCPPEFIGVPMLTTLGAAIGNSRVLRLKKGYTQGAVLYTAIVAEPGAKKSPAARVRRRELRGSRAWWGIKVGIHGRGLESASPEPIRNRPPYQQPKAILGRKVAQEGLRWVRYLRRVLVHDA